MQPAVSAAAACSNEQSAVRNSQRYRRSSNMQQPALYVINSSVCNHRQHYYATTINMQQ